jgi:hypothetical protein
MFCNGVAAGPCSPSIEEGGVACFRQRNKAGAAQTDIAATPENNNTQNPALRSRRLDHQIKSATIGVPAGRFKLANLDRCQNAIRMFSTMYDQVTGGPTIHPTKIVGWWRPAMDRAEPPMSTKSLV